jgi:hypothetical protein
MSSKIKSCFMDDQPEFYSPVVHDKVEIATIRALTDEDREVLNQKGGVVFRDEDGEVKTYITKPKAYENYLIVLSLGGYIDGLSFKKGREGWNFERKVSFDSVSVIYSEYRQAILTAIIKHIESWEKNKDSILKN